MKWAGHKIRTGLVSKLNPIVPTYDMKVPLSLRNGVFCIIANYSQTNEDTKDSFMGTATQNLEFHKVVQGQFGDRTDMDILIDSCLTALRPLSNTPSLSAQDFTIIGIRLINSIDDLQENNGELHYVNILTFEIDFVQN